jgi:hypothetical protein
MSLELTYALCLLFGLYLCRKTIAEIEKASQNVERYIVKSSSAHSSTQSPSQKRRLDGAIFRTASTGTKLGTIMTAIKVVAFFLLLSVMVFIFQAACIDLMVSVHWIAIVCYLQFEFIGYLSMVMVHFVLICAYLKVGWAVRLVEQGTHNFKSKHPDIIPSDRLQVTTQLSAV